MMESWERAAALAMSAVMAGAMLTGCGGGSETTEAAKGNKSKAETGTQAGKDADEAADNGEKKQVYVFVRDRGDLSYWGSMVAGGDRAMTDYADRVDVYVAETMADLQANLQAMYEAADKGADLTVTAFDFKDNLVEVANGYPDIAFTIVSEDVIDRCENSNVYSVDSATSQIVFLGGIVAAGVAVNDAKGMDPINVVGFVGGMDESLIIQEFLWGYIQGIQYYDPDTEIVYNYVDAWNDPDIVKTQTMTQYNDADVDVIFACADGSDNGIRNVTEEARKFVIGVDSNQSQLYEDDRAIQEESLTSVMKEVGDAVYSMIGEYLDSGILPYGEYEVLGLPNGAVSIMEGDQLNGALLDEDKVKLEEAKVGTADGSIEVKSAIGKGQDEVEAPINESYQQGKKEQLIGMLEDWKKER